MSNVSISTMINKFGRQMHNMCRNQKWEVNITASQMAVLTFVARQCEEGIPVFQKDIEREFNIKGSSVTSILNALEKNKWISREKVDYDARLRKIVLAEMSFKMIDQMKEFWNEIDLTIKKSLTDAELIVFCQCMDKINNALNG